MRKAMLAIAIPVVIMGYALFDQPDYEGPHVIDGYHIGREIRCPGTSGNSYCAVAVPVATEALVSRDPGAVVVRASIAEQMCSDTICTTAGLARQYFVVFNLEDGSRKAIGVACGALVVDGALKDPACVPSAPPSIGG